VGSPIRGFAGFKALLQERPFLSLPPNPPPTPIPISLFLEHQFPLSGQCRAVCPSVPLGSFISSRLCRPLPPFFSISPHPLHACFCPLPSLPLLLFLRCHLRPPFFVAYSSHPSLRSLDGQPFSPDFVPPMNLFFFLTIIQNPFSGFLSTTPCSPIVLPSPGWAHTLNYFFSFF